jgi:hypothetical protein
MAPTNPNYFNYPYPDQPAPNWESLYGDPYGSLSLFQNGMTGRTITTGSANDSIHGTTGQDLIRSGSGNDTIGPSYGNDWVDAGAGSDSVKAGGGHDFVLGRDGDDLIYGESGNDWIDGGAGADRLYGGTSDDLIFGGADNDLLDGGDGNDMLDGGQGNDNLHGGAGNDVLKSGAEGGTDHLYGGDGNNLFLGWHQAGDAEGRHAHYQLEGKQDEVWDNGISDNVDYLHYSGNGSAEIHWFGGAAQTVYDPENYALPPFHSFGTTDKVVFENVYVRGDKIDNLIEFKQMISNGWIKYSHDSAESNEVPAGYYPPDGSSTVWNWDVGNISLDFGAAADGTERTLTFLQTSLSGIGGWNDFKDSDWLFA